METVVETIVVVGGVMLFLWASAVLASGGAMLMSEGRLARRQWRKLAIAVIALIVCVIGYLQRDVELQPPMPVNHGLDPVPQLDLRQ